MVKVYQRHASRQPSSRAPATSITRCNFINRNTDPTSHEEEHVHKAMRRRPRRSTIVPPYLTCLIILALSPVTKSVILADFQPSIDSETLSNDCKVIYSSPIPGCKPEDFFGESPVCGDQCIAGMLSLTSDVFDACGGNPDNDQGIVGAFLIGSGPTSLCPNAEVKTEPYGLWGPSTSLDGPSTSIHKPTTTHRPSSTTDPPTAKPYTPDSSRPTPKPKPKSPQKDDQSSTSTTTRRKSMTTSSSSSSSTSNDFNNPPSGLPSTGALDIPTTLPETPAAQETDCVQNGGGGSLIGDKTCPSGAGNVLRITPVQWVMMALGLLAGARSVGWQQVR